jgi:MFS family permease
MFGMFVATPAAGHLMSRYGWESVFYFYGTVAVLAVVVWEFLVYDSPDDHPRISEAERRHIVDRIGVQNTGSKKEMRVNMLAFFLPFTIDQALIGLLKYEDEASKGRAWPPRRSSLQSQPLIKAITSNLQPWCL